ncbi:MAG: hypothetical protein LBJ07_01390, partial [Actinomycetes bacterium]|nr:hypothetical protein [Actinomycetes bacterium]
LSGDRVVVEALWRAFYGYNTFNTIRIACRFIGSIVVQRGPDDIQTLASWSSTLYQGLRNGSGGNNNLAYYYDFNPPEINVQSITTPPTIIYDTTTKITPPSILGSEIVRYTNESINSGENTAIVAGGNLAATAAGYLIEGISGRQGVTNTAFTATTTGGVGWVSHVSGHTHTNPLIPCWHQPNDGTRYTGIGVSTHEYIATDSWPYKIDGSGTQVANAADQTTNLTAASVSGAVTTEAGAGVFTRRIVVKTKAAPLLKITYDEAGLVPYYVLNSDGTYQIFDNDDMNLTVKGDVALGSAGLLPSGTDVTLGALQALRWTNKHLYLWVWSAYKGQYSNVAFNELSQALGTAVVDTVANPSLNPTTVAVKVKVSSETKNAGNSYFGRLYATSLLTDLLSGSGAVNLWIDKTDPVPAVSTTDGGLTFSDTSHDDQNVTGNSGIHHTRMVIVPAGSSRASVEALPDSDWLSVDAATIRLTAEGSFRPTGAWDVWVRTWDNASNVSLAKGITLKHNPPRVVLSLDAIKTLSGGGKTNTDISAGQFSFEATLTSGEATHASGLPSAAVVCGTGTTTGAAVDFADVELLAAGTYVFAVRETSAGGAGYTTDPNTVFVTVVVTDNGDGTFSHSITRIKDGQTVPTISFANTYTLQEMTFEFIKTTPATTVSLPGAQFKLYRLTCTDESHNHSADPVTPALIASGCFTAVLDGLSDKIWTSASDGSVNLGTLLEGEYRLIEIQAPSGYHTPIGQWRIVVTPNASGTPTLSIVALGVVLPPAFEIDTSGGTPTYRLPNHPANVFPLAGSTASALLFTLLGGGLIVLGVAYGIVSATRKKTLAALGFSRAAIAPAQREGSKVGAGTGKFAKLLLFLMAVMALLSFLLLAISWLSPASAEAEVIVDTNRPGSITLYAYDYEQAATPLQGDVSQIPPSARPLAGVQFMLERTDISGFSARYGQTDRDGTLLFSKLAVGSWKVTRIENKQTGLSEAVFFVDIPTTLQREDETSELIYDVHVHAKGGGEAPESQTMDTYGGVRALKVDAKNHKQLLAGAVFRLVKRETSSYTKDFQANGYLSLSGKIVSATSDKKGRVIFESVPYQNTTTSTGFSGRYWLVEIKAPSGYEKADEPLAIQVDDNSFKVDFYKYTIPNTRIVPVQFGKQGDTTKFLVIAEILILALLAVVLALRRRRGPAHLSVNRLI